MMFSQPWKAGLAGIALVTATTCALAQTHDHSAAQAQPGSAAQGQQHTQDQQTQPAPPPHDMHKQMMQMHQGMHGGMQGGMQAQPGEHSAKPERTTGASNQPTQGGQDAFATIQEIVRILEADPATDWSMVNIDALRQHLIDMNEVTLRATATQRVLDNGVEIAVTGEGRTLDAIRRMVPPHVSELNRIGWDAKTDELPNGVKLTVTSTDASRLTKLQALGFMGIMVQGSHHQPHHLMMAKGKFAH